MPRFLTCVMCVLLTGVVCLAGQAAPAGASSAHPAKARRAKHASTAAKPEVQPELPPPPPPTPEQMPAVAPQVRFSNGLLSVNAQNSTLGDILSAVRSQTGATIDLPPGVGSERVAARLGPAPAKDVLSSLLTGSNFNYIILGSEAQPDGVQRIIVTARAGAAAPVAAPPQAANLPVQNRIMVPQPEPPDMEEEAQELQDDQQPPPAAPGQPANILPGQPQALPPDQNAQPQQPDPNQTRTPEQMLQELQRMQRLSQPSGQPPQQQPQ